MSDDWWEPRTDLGSSGLTRVVYNEESDPKFVHRPVGFTAVFPKPASEGIAND